ncbi:MAG TPA: hypothetical protein VMM58_06155 [Bacteroidota bacterium]|nr:hypothetical protein [Bacteroidota bacterium]
MKYRLLLIGLVAGAATASAQFTSGRFTTSFYGWQGRGAALETQNYLRGFENVQFDFTQERYSFNTNFQLSKDFGTVISTDPEMRLSSLTVKAREIADVADVSVGRQFVFAGVGNGLMDGVVAKASLFDRKVAVTAYGGYNVIQSRTIDLKRSFPDNALYGGQVTFEPVDNGIVGLSYMNRTRKPEPFTAVRADSLFNPYVIVIAYSPEVEEYASLDARYDFLNKVNVYGRSDYDLNFSRISRAQVEANFGIVSSLSASADYLYRQPRVAYNSIFSVFNTNSTQEIEGGLEYEVTPSVRTFARYAAVQYTDANSGRLTVGGTYDIVNLSYTQNFGYAGDLNGVSLQAVYPMMERKLTPNFGFGIASYQLEDNGPKNNVLNSSVGATYRPSPALSTDILVQWMRNPLYANDVRVFAKVNYWFSDRLSWF